MLLQGRKFSRQEVIMLNPQGNRHLSSIAIALLAQNPGAATHAHLLRQRDF